MPSEPSRRINWDALTEARRTFIGNPYQLTREQLAQGAHGFDAGMASVPYAMTSLCERGLLGDARKMVLAAAHHAARRAASNSGRNAGEAATHLREALATLEAAAERCIPLGLRVTASELRRLAWALYRFNVAEAALVGSSAAMRHVKDALWTASFGPNLYVTLERQLAVRQHNVLLLGEPGTGKELAAKVLQAAVLTDGEAAPPSCDVNCPGIPHDLAEAELFGAEKGAHSKADARRVGKIVSASGGTIFLDEVADLPLDLQAKLLVALSNGKVTPLGANDPIDVDVRYVSATSRPLFAMVQEGKIRDDLFHRLGQTILDMPPLRDRPEDIGEIARTLLYKLAPPEDGLETASSQIVPVDKEFEAWLRDEAGGLPWTGNVRELQNAVRARVLGFRPSPQERGARGSIAPAVESGGGGVSGSAEAIPVEIVECRASEAEVVNWYLQRVVRRVNGNLSEASRILGVDRGTIKRRLEKLAGRGDPQE